MSKKRGWNPEMCYVTVLAVHLDAAIQRWQVALYHRQAVSQYNSDGYLLSTMETGRRQQLYLRCLDTPYIFVISVLSFIALYRPVTS